MSQSRACCHGFFRRSLITLRLFVVIVIWNSPFINRNSKAKRRAPAYSRALLPFTILIPPSVRLSLSIRICLYFPQSVRFPHLVCMRPILHCGAFNACAAYPDGWSNPDNHAEPRRLVTLRPRTCASQNCTHTRARTHIHRYVAKRYLLTDKSIRLSDQPNLPSPHTHTHTHECILGKHIYVGLYYVECIGMFVYVFICAYVCVCVCLFSPTFFSSCILMYTWL